MTKISDAAHRWWSSRRPIGWTVAAHLETPTVNTRDSWERELALSVAASIRSRGVPTLRAEDDPRRTVYGVPAPVVGK